MLRKLLCCALFLFLLPAAHGEIPTPTAKSIAPVPKAPAVNARGFIVLDYDSGAILAEQDADLQVEPASLTKLMTAYVVFKALAEGSIKLDDMVTISENAWRTAGSRMFVEVNTKVSINDLLQGMIVQSGNDATVALAEHVAGAEDTFAGLMNQEAARLGMRNSRFVNSPGLPDPTHLTTARDIAILARAIIREFPEYYKWYSQREFTYANITQLNRNKLLWRDASVDGMKTGYTETAGYCLVTSAKRENMRLISVVMGSENEKTRADASQALLNYGFRFFETHKLYDGGAVLTQARVWKGAESAVPVGPVDTFYITIPRGQYDQLQAGMTIDDHIMAPVSNGAKLGLAQVQLGDKIIAERALVAQRDIPIGSFWQRMVDSARLYFE